MVFDDTFIWFKVLKMKYVLLLRKYCCKRDDNYTATTAGKQYVRSYIN